MIFPRKKEKTNDELAITLIEIQGYLMGLGAGVHKEWHEQLNEIRARLEAVEEVKEKMCDHFCRVPHEACDEEEVEELCKLCPLKKLEGKA